MHGGTRRSVEQLEVGARHAGSLADPHLQLRRNTAERAANAHDVSDAPSPPRPGAPPCRADIVHLQRTMGNTAVARALHGSGVVVGDSTYLPGARRGKSLLAPELPRAGQASVQRNKKSRKLLKTLATPQVRQGPAIEVQKNLVTGLESRLATIIKSDAKKQAKDDTKLEKWFAAHKAWQQRPKWLRGSEPMAPTPSFGGDLRAQVTEENAKDFNLGGILIDGLPEYQEENVEGFYAGLARTAGLVPLDGRVVAGSNSGGIPVPELVAGLEGLVVENTLRTMIDASQFDYLLAAGLPNAQWKILVEVHYVRARPKDMAGFHKDTQGQTLFVNLNYHAGEHSLRGPEYVLNPPHSETHDELIYGTRDKSGTLPSQFTQDLSHVRGQLGVPTEIRSSGTVKPYGYVAFVDEAIHHATPFFENRYITPTEFEAYLQRADKRKLDEIIRAKKKGVEVDRSVIGPDEVEKWTAWWKMITNPATGTRYTRLDFAATLKGDEFDRVLENVGAQKDAKREGGGAGGWYAASIPKAGLAPVHASDKPPLVRQASDPDLSKTWPKQLPDDVPRRFLRTWVRAVPEAMAAQLRRLG